MADKMLARLDQLQRGARETQPRLQEHNTHNDYGRYDVYEDVQGYYDGDEVYGDENAYPSDLRDALGG
jgi:hypothetical protein